MPTGAYPRRRSGHVNHSRFILRLQTTGALIIRRRALRVRAGCHQFGSHCDSPLSVLVSGLRKLSRKDWEFLTTLSETVNGEIVYLIATGLTIDCTPPVIRAAPSVKRNSQAWSLTIASGVIFSRM